MTNKQMQQQRLKEISRLVDTLTERMMTSYVVGSQPTDTEVVAFCRGVLLLEEHGIPLPHFADDVIARLQAREDAAHVTPPAQQAAHIVCAVSVIGRLLRPFRMLQAA